MCTQSEALEIFGEAVKRCRELFGDSMRDAYLYGSYARGDYDDESDIDILVTVDKGAEELSHLRKSVSHINSDLGLDHDIVVSITAKPLEQFLYYSDVLPYYKNVLKDGIKYAE